MFTEVRAPPVARALFFENLKSVIDISRDYYTFIAPPEVYA